MRNHLVSVTVLIALTAVSFFVFPGHTYLQSDTQIYVPILERLWDPSVFRHEIIARQPHVSFTMYDETAIWLRKATGLGFREVLALQQGIARFCGLAGVYLIALALRLRSLEALAVAAACGLGATILGPSVLTFEYEPVPRGTAVGLTLLAIGLVAQQRHLLAGCAAGLAFLYQVPAVYPYWLAYFLLALIPSEPEQMRRRIRGLLPMAVAVVLLFVLSQWQQGVSEGQEFFSRVDAAQEAVMRTRASYNWVSLWPPRYYWHYAILWAVSLLALWRLRTRLPADFRMMAAAMPAIGMLSMPVSWLLLEQVKWFFITQFQPLRSLLYVAAFAVILSAAAGVAAARERKWLECPAWFLPVFTLPAQTRTIDYLFDWGAPAQRQAALVAISLAIACALAFWLAARFRWAQILPLATVMAAYWAIPALAKVRNYPQLHHAELDELAWWARNNTAKDAVFLFPDAGRDLHPGIFRAQSLRTVYVDWKGGGQINFIREFLTQWQPRWRQLMEPAFVPERLERYHSFGIDYIVVSRDHAVRDATPAYANRRYVAYRTPNHSNQE
ncbi:MAG: hypothetical protein HY235_22850 [Acidobacteria bacterium]|nr:hypothetical protein [Acidobacteriota bacterium]